LAQAGIIAKQPRLIGVQSETCAPLWAALHHVDETTEADTLAEGIRILDPVRKQEVLTSIATSKGEIVTVSEADIAQGLQSLARQGFLVEPTSAVVWPAYLKVRHQFGDTDRIVLSLTGSGLKTPNPQQFLYWN
jgi:threonine synthase